MQQFMAGEVKTAIAPMSNPTPKAFDYGAGLYMGRDLILVASKDFHLEPGELKNIQLPVVMPSVPGIYPVNIVVFSGGEFVPPVYQIEDIEIISAIPTININPNIYLVTNIMDYWGTPVVSHMVNPKAVHPGEAVHVFVLYYTATAGGQSGDILFEWDGNYEVWHIIGLQKGDMLGADFWVYPTEPGVYQPKFNYSDKVSGQKLPTFTVVEPYQYILKITEYDYDDRNIGRSPYKLFYEAGDVVTLGSTDEGTIVDYWTVDGVRVDGEELTITVTRNHVIVAYTHYVDIP